MPDGASNRRTRGLRPAWKPGTSRNPLGRPPASMDISLLCRQHAPEAIERLLYLLRSDDNRAVAWAIGIIFDRASAAGDAARMARPFGRGAPHIPCGPATSNVHRLDFGSTGSSAGMGSVAVTGNGWRRSGYSVAALCCSSHRVRAMTIG